MDHSSFLKKGGWERYLQIWKEYELDKEKSSVLWMRREEGCFISAHDGIRRLQHEQFFTELTEAEQNLTA